MQITHEEARRLIQYKADNGLNSTGEERLSAHLLICSECRNYINTIKDTEAILRQTFRKQWNVRPLPLQMDFVFEKVNSRDGMNVIMTTRMALISIAFVLLTFFTWQSITTSRTASTAPGMVPLIPTPSMQFTATNTLQNDCYEIQYVIQEGDTLESIARRFSISIESILSANNITGETFGTKKELLLPICGSTATGTTQPPTFTITPVFEMIRTTPG